MPDSKPERWPKWNEPATKGDIIASLVATRACIVDIYIVLRAMRRNDFVVTDETLDRLNINDEKLNALMDQIGGQLKND